MARIIAISGGSDGLGKAIAQIFCATDTVIILAPDEAKTKSVAASLGCDYFPCDITDYAQIEKAVGYILGKYDHLDILINNAGIWIEGPLDQNDPGRIHRVLEVNTLGTIWLTRAFLPGLKSRQSGMIVNIISQAGLNVKADRSVYYASKWAVTGFTKCLREDLRPFNIPVIGVYPSKMKTPIFSKAGINKDLHDALDPQSVARSVVDSINNPSVLNSLDITLE